MTFVTHHCRRLRRTTRCVRPWTVRWCGSSRRTPLPHYWCLWPGWEYFGCCCRRDLRDRKWPVKWFHWASGGCVRRIIFWNSWKKIHPLHLLLCDKLILARAQTCTHAPAQKAHTQMYSHHTVARTHATIHVDASGHKRVHMHKHCACMINKYEKETKTHKSLCNTHTHTPFLLNFRGESHRHI